MGRSPAQCFGRAGRHGSVSLDVDGAVKCILSSARILTMQKFIEADYYELDWYYEECSDGNYDSCRTERGCVGPLSPSGEGVSWNLPGETGGRRATGPAPRGSDPCEGVVEETAGGQGS